LPIFAAEWNSLEIAKLAVGALTPILIVGLGWVISRAAQRIEDAQWINRKVIEQRLALFEEVAPKLNDLYCFFMRVGNFQDVTPPEAIQRKRELDKLFHSHEPLFSPTVADCYLAFIKACFGEFEGGVARPAKIRASRPRQLQERGRAWKRKWDPLFAADGNEHEIKVTHDKLLEAFGEEVGARTPDRSKRGWLAPPP
jgi:hypothetical protein